MGLGFYMRPVWLAFLEMLLVGKRSQKMPVISVDLQCPTSTNQATAYSSREQNCLLWNSIPTFLATSQGVTLRLFSNQVGSMLFLQRCSALRVEACNGVVQFASVVPSEHSNKT